MGIERSDDLVFNLRSLHQRTHLKIMTLNSPGEKLVRRPRISAMALELVWAHVRKVQGKTAGRLLDGCTFYSPRQRLRRTSHGNSARWHTRSACGAREVLVNALVHPR